ncbi:transmembrane protein 273 [Lepus europaeus]|uniref:transmembrane protein 273 n=1 Tax=Lepus europaeus TaxID=9983 RepID=UPI002B46CA64|nr:transmembrane protein 273 [Lepus europaeus]
MGLGSPVRRALLFLLDVGSAQVLETGKAAGTDIDFKYAIIGAAVGVAISAGFLALKICVIRKHLLDNESSDLRSTAVGLSDSTARKKRMPRDAQVIEL